MHGLPNVKENRNCSEASAATKGYLKAPKTSRMPVVNANVAPIGAIWWASGPKNAPRGRDTARGADIDSVAREERENRGQTVTPPTAMPC